MNIKQINEGKKEFCSGCGACAMRCPRACITLERDEEGFRYPVIREEACTDCGKCISVCPFLQAMGSDVKGGEHPKEAVPKLCVGGWHKDEEKRSKSSSGGAFSLFADWILQNGGIVYGCTLDGKLQAVHVGVESPDRLFVLMGSKYVQSDLNSCYREIETHLRGGRYVLFTGSTCQTAGLKAFLGREYERLYSVDFICHGVPSQLFFDRYLQSLRDRYQEEIVDFRFRLKDKGWSPTGLQMGTRAETESGEHHRFFPAYRDSYMNGFLSDVCLRPSCYHCAFKGKQGRYSDVTIADFWGGQKIDRRFSDKKGTSLVLIHSGKGMELFEAVKQDFCYEPCEFREAVRGNKSYFRSAEEHPGRADFYRDLNASDFDTVRKKYLTGYDWFTYRFYHALDAFLEKKIHRTVSYALVRSLFQFVKFGIVGVSNTALNYGIYTAMLYLIQKIRAGLVYDYQIAHVVAFLLSVLWAYVWNSRFTFAEADSGRWWQKLIKTYLSYGFSNLLLKGVMLILLVQLLGVSKWVAPLVTIVITVPINFLLNKLWVYRTGENRGKRGA